MTPPVLAVENVSKRFGGTTALENVSLEFHAGECHAVVGENGAGKSTLMKILAGVITDYDGVLRRQGAPVRFRSTRDAEQSGIGIIHQELNLVEPLSASANIFLGREIRTRWGGLDDAAMNRRAAEILGELECHVPPGEPVGPLRIGDQQLIEIARACSGILHADRRSLAGSVLILDEPTSALTEAEAVRLHRVLERLRARGATLLYISHKMDEVFKLADRISVLRDGRSMGTLARAEAGGAEIASRMVGREIDECRFPPRIPGETLLAVENLSLPWPGHARQWRLRNVSFELRAGEVLGLAGLMGAGRTELLECLFGCRTEPLHGTMRLRSPHRGAVPPVLAPYAPRHPRDALRAGVALVTEDRKRLGLLPNFDVAQNVTLGRLPRLTRGLAVSARRERAAASAAVAQYGIKTGRLDAPIASLSGGNQQKAILARALLTEPRVLLLDDPTRGVDVGAKADLYRLIDRLCRDGMGVVMTSSELPELLLLCDRILVLREGRLTAEFRRSDGFSEQSIMEAATRGLAEER